MFVDVYPDVFGGKDAIWHVFVQMGCNNQLEILGFAFKQIYQ